ncbi:hypothetical protein Pla111_15470 [Botrimarina hoheduenensis]|uniref:Uncharacterized protein n=2 Tax=Botrimarina hoheduenensis TaxID=2528000 RepID=A0A5C5W8V4_9BACT|nr:hypothetical protein Pla111_15470 [Botrimarina hoheduenensis]
MQVIVLGLAASPTLFAFITLFLKLNPLGADAQSMLVTIALVVGLVGMIFQQILGDLVRNASVRSLGAVAIDEPAKLAGSYVSGLLVSCALCEGAAFINLIAFMITRAPLTLAMGLLLVLASALKFPTIGRVAAWARGEARRLAEIAALR